MMTTQERTPTSVQNTQLSDGETAQHLSYTERAERAFNQIEESSQAALHALHTLRTLAEQQTVNKEEPSSPKA